MGLGGGAVGFEGCWWGIGRGGGEARESRIAGSGSSLTCSAGLAVGGAVCGLCVDGRSLAAVCDIDDLQPLNKHDIANNTAEILDNSGLRVVISHKQLRISNNNYFEQFPPSFYEVSLFQKIVAYRGFATHCIYYTRNHRGRYQ